MKLTYFDIDGSRGEPARLALYCAGIEFEDHRISFAQFRETQDSFPFRAVPTLEVDGEVITHSNGINRYVGKLAGMYPDDPWQAARCDEVMGAVEDVVVLVTQTMPMPDGDEKKAAREKLATGAIWTGAGRAQTARAGSARDRRILRRQSRR